MVDIGHGWRIDPRCDEWNLPDLWQLHLYGYHADFDVGHHRLTVAPGTVSLAPPGWTIRHHYRGESGHLFAHLAVSGDVAPEQDRPVAARIPAVTRLSSDPAGELLTFRGLFDEAIAARGADPDRARAAVWLMLSRLAARPGGGELRASVHPVVTAVIEQIDRRLSGPLRVAELAREASVSQNYLARLFRAGCGSTVSAYIRRRRLERARSLLAHSTLPVAAVARMVGIPDLQAFNKAFRAESGVSPRAFRAGAMPESDDSVWVR